MDTTNGDQHGRRAISLRIDEIEAKFHSLDDWQGPRRELVRLWELLLAERADLQGKIGEGR